MLFSLLVVLRLMLLTAGLPEPAGQGQPAPGVWQPAWHCLPDVALTSPETHGLAPATPGSGPAYSSAPGFPWVPGGGLPGWYWVSAWPPVRLRATPPHRLQRRRPLWAIVVPNAP